ncbi:DUF6101 family protein [Limoniibacter endophyticus]|uniref:Uncharacterized protein n=1 Tax=Limoniibacter endophyticus TaxID=1565040 RepID=A0A8J3DQ93_9HYPH|nr:DUF6101 family protein [Limoniibacter endophyticus]GHC71389.1 hypothetical protein GCM10010136_18520 [Limoniibacter endophyticus]
MTMGLKPVWAEGNLRLDPWELPQATSYSLRGEAGDVTFTVDHRGARIRRLLDRSRLPVTIMLPFHAFQGVAARAIEDENGFVTVTLELLHEDASLCVPLLIANDLGDVAGDWRAWSDMLKLPMLLIESDGIARSLEETMQMEISLHPGYERRKRRHSAEKRPRFLARRKTGSLGLRVVVEGREIIARR